MNTYAFRGTLFKEIIKEINIRHDRSGTYPQSALEYQGENWLVDLVRAPLDDKYRCLNMRLAASSDPMELR